MANRLPIGSGHRSRIVIFLSITVAIALWLGACSRGGDALEGGLSSNVTVELMAPEAGSEVLSVRVMDLDGNPISDAKVSLEGNMNHAGMVPVLAGPVEDGADGADDGVYTVPFEFTMLGDWIIAATVESAESPVIQEFYVRVGTDGAELVEP